MGQSQGRKTGVDDKTEVKRFASEGGCGQSESSEIRDSGATTTASLGSFMKLKKTASTKTPENGGSDDSMESIGLLKILNGSEQTLDLARKGEAEEESKDDESLPIVISPQEITNDGNVGRYSTVVEVSGNEQDCKRRATDLSASKSELGETEVDSGDLEAGEGEETPGSEVDLVVERDSLEEQLLKLETPLKWFHPIISKAALPSNVFSDAIRDSVGGWRVKWSQDHFRVSTYHLCLSAKCFLVDGDPQKALKELSMSRRAKVRFLDAIFRQENSEYDEKWSSEGKRGDEDVDRALSIVIGGTAAAISFKLEKFGDTTRVLKTLMKQSTSIGVRAAIKGIEASVLGCMHSCLPNALDAARDAVAMDPGYWRWHALLANLLRHHLSVEAKDDSRRREMLNTLESVCRLEPSNVNRLLLLADGYRDAAFQGRKRQDLDEDFKEYATKAIKTYMLVVDREPQCIRSHVSVARSLWNLRWLRPEATQRAISIAERALRILTADAERDELGMDDSRSNAELEVQAESALALGLMWELIGNVDRALCLFRMAATNPRAPISIAYRAELGIIVSNFKKGKFGKGKADIVANVDIVCQLDKLLARFSDSDLQQQTLCHKGHYLMAIMKDNFAALKNFCEAINIRSESPFLKRYYPRFTSDCTHHPLQISDLIHELACKELARVQVRASKGSPEAMRRSKLLNEQIQLAQNIVRAQYMELNDEGKTRTSSNGSGDAPPTVINFPIPKKKIMGKYHNSPDVSCDWQVSSNIKNHSVGKPVLENVEVGGAVTENDLVVNSVTENRELCDGVKNGQEVDCTTIGNQAVQSGEVVCEVIKEAIISVPQPDVDRLGNMSVSDRLILMFRETTV